MVRMPKPPAGAHDAERNLAAIGDQDRGGSDGGEFRKRKVIRHTSGRRGRGPVTGGSIAPIARQSPSNVARVGGARSRQSSQSRAVQYVRVGLLVEHLAQLRLVLGEIRLGRGDWREMLERRRSISTELADVGAHRAEPRIGPHET